MIIDTHVHSKFSFDGLSSMEEHCLRAIKIGLSKICFTEHVDFNKYEYNLGKIKDVSIQNFNTEIGKMVNAIRRTVSMKLR